MDKIITILKKIHKKYRFKKGDVSEHTKAAQKITTKWQNKVCNDLIKKEVEIKNNNEKIDIIDFNSLTAYELKVSGKNPKHEFFKDIFKVILFNEYSNKKIRKLKYISEKEGIKELNRIDPKLSEIINKKHKIDIELISI